MVIDGKRGYIAYFRQSLKEVVSKRKDTIVQISKKTKVTRASIHNWLNGSTFPSKAALSDLLDIIKTPQENRKRLLRLHELSQRENPRIRNRKKLLIGGITND